MEHMHDGHRQHSVANFRNRFWVCLVLTLPVIAYSDFAESLFGIVPPHFSGDFYIPFIFSTIIYFYGGLVFIKGALNEIKNKYTGMMTLVALAISVAYFYSSYSLLNSGIDFFWELVTLIDIMLLGHWIEIASIDRAENSIKAIADLLPDKAELLLRGKPKTIKLSELKKDDLVLIRPGARVPTDGLIVEGRSSVDESIITGESLPKPKKVGDEVVAGSINQDGLLTVSVQKVGESTVVAGIGRMVAEAQASKSGAQILADRAASLLTIVAILTAAATFVVWLWASNSNIALERAVTVLVIACPHALGLAIPLVVALSTARAAKNGLLVRQRSALESAHNLDWVLFDKTGTLTKGAHSVAHVWPTSDLLEKEILQIAATLEQFSEHVVGKGIVKRAEEWTLKLSKVKDFKALPGVGVEGKIDGKAYVVANREYIDSKKLALAIEVEDQIKAATKEGKTDVYLLDEDKILGAIALADLPKDDAYLAVKSIQKMGIKTALLTGDSEEVASFVAKNLGIDKYFSGIKPVGKVDIVKKLQKGGQKVAMVGDGVNDAPALAQADIGIAMGGGTDIAIKSAGIVLVKNNPTDVARAIKLSMVNYGKMAQNLFWATGYNLVAIPLAAGVLYNQGVVLSPAVGAIFMILSTLIVTVNSWFLRYMKI